MIYHLLSPPGGLLCPTPGWSESFALFQPILLLWFCCLLRNLRGKSPPSLRNPFLLLGTRAASRPADGPRCRSQAPLQVQLAPRVWPQVAAFRQHDLTSWFPRITCCLPCAAPGLAVGPGRLPQPSTGQLRGSGLCQVPPGSPVPTPGRSAPLPFVGCRDEAAAGRGSSGPG